MPIITPSFPAFNTAYNVNTQHLKILMDEFRRGFQIVSRIQAREVEEKSFPSSFAQECYLELIRDYFFDEVVYTNFLLINIVADNSDDMSKWLGIVQSRMRRFLFENLYDLLDKH